MSFRVGTEIESNWEVLQEFVDNLVYKKTSYHLKDIEITVLHMSWEDFSYEQMAKASRYSAEYLNKDVGNKLWRKLTEILGEKVSKRNFKEALKRAWRQDQRQISPLMSTVTVFDHP